MFVNKITKTRSQKIFDPRHATNNMHKQRSFILTYRLWSAHKIDMSGVTNWSMLREYKKADIHPLTHVHRAKNRQDNRSTWNFRLKLTNAVVYSRKTFRRNPKICRFLILFISIFFSLFTHFV